MQDSYQFIILRVKSYLMFNKKTYIMKTHFPFCKGFIMAAALTSIMGLSSCLDDDDENYYYILKSATYRV